MSNMKDLVERITDVRANPANIQRTVLNTLEEVVDGQYDVVDPSNPFLFLLESSCAVAAAGIQRSEALLRRQYPSLAVTAEDLYHHMTDEDYANRFAVPSRVGLTLMLSLDEVHQRAIDAGNGVRKLTIPRDTEVTVEDIVFTLHYPIEIRVMPHGGVQVVYDTDVPNPLKVLESNVLDWEIVRLPLGEGETTHLKMLTIEIPIEQFKIEDHYDQLNPSSGFTKVYSFSDQFYYARVYTSNGENGEWREIRTTHSDQVFDPTVPTAALTVLDGQVRVHIPQIYFTNNSIGRGIRVDVYSTQGSLERSLTRYNPTNFKARWRDLSRNESPFVAPIRAFSTMTMFSSDTVRGGRNALAFDALRQRVIDNALGPIQIPITEAQLQARMDNLGYDIIKDVDNITNRIYLASRTLPEPSVQEVSSPAACTVTMLQTSVDQLAEVGTVYDNEIRATIRANTLMEIDNGILKLVNDNLKDQILSSNPDNRVALASERRFVFTPFDYVLDMTQDVFDVRPYDFSRPKISSKTFVDENQSLKLEVTTMRYGISKHDGGYRITLITRSGDVFRALSDDQVIAQMSFVPDGEIDRAYLNGRLEGRTNDDEYVFVFDLDSRFDVDAQDNLQLTSFKMFDLENRSLGTPLTNQFDLFYIVKDYTVDGGELSELDNIKGTVLLEDNTTVVIQESLKVTFGDALPGLWSRARTVAGSAEYLRYDADVPAVYEENVYRRDPVTNTIAMTYDSESGDIVYEVLHQAGDPVLDGDGLPVMKHHKGDIKLDHDGNPIPVNERKLLRQMDLLLFEGSLYFVTDDRTKRVATEARNVIADWVTSDVSQISESLLENTRLWFYPQTTFGDVDVLVEENSTTSIDANQSFDVKIYLSRLGYDNGDLRSDLTDLSVRVITEALKRLRVSVGEIAQEIRAQAGNEVYDVVVGGLGGDQEYEMITIKDPSTRLGIRKRLTVLPDNKITVNNDITVEFVRHTD